MGLRMEEDLHRARVLCDRVRERLAREAFPAGHVPVEDRESLIRDFLDLLPESMHARKGQVSSLGDPSPESLRRWICRARNLGLGLPDGMDLALGARRALGEEARRAAERGGGTVRRLEEACDRAILGLSREWDRAEVGERSILEALSLPVFRMREGLQVCWCNQAARDLFLEPDSPKAGVQEPSRCGRMVPELAVSVAAMIQAGTREAYLEKEVETRTGRRFMGIRVQRVASSQGGGEEFVVVLTDLTRRHVMETHLRQARQAVEEKARFRAEELERANHLLVQQAQERSASEAVLRESEERYRLLVNLSPDGIVVHQRGRVVFCNEAAAAILGASPQEISRLLGQPVLDFVHPEYRQVVVERIQRMSQEPVWVPPLEERFVGLRGEVVDVEVKASAMTWEGEPAVMVVFRDIRERRRAQRELEERTAAIEVLIESRERLAKASPESLPDEVARTFGKALRVYRLYWCVPGEGGAPFRIAGRFCWFDADRAAMQSVSAIPQELFRDLERAAGTGKIGLAPLQGETLSGERGFRGDARSLLLVPVASRDRLFGVMLACCREEKGFPEARRLVAQTAAGYLAAALENVQLTLRLREAEARYRSIFTNALEGFYAVGANGRLITANPALARILGYQDVDEMMSAIGDFRQALHADERQREMLLHALEERGEVTGAAYLARRADGSRIWVSETAWSIRDDGGQVLRREGIVEDIHERRMMETQWQRVQKMEALGRLAGGVAHDFNNLLAAILGFAGILLEDEKLDPKARDLVKEIHLAGERGAELTRRLLVFSRGQTAESCDVEMVAAIRGMSRFLMRLLGEEIEYRSLLPDEAIWTHLQGGMLEQVLMNLVVNARDAMPQGGRLTIRVSRRVVLPEEKFREGVVTPGEYGEIQVEDTGVGMDPELLARIFEPFFSTKESGKGTGLGLSVVYGIVKKSGGVILVDSEVGRGSRFRILLPVIPPPAAATASGHPVP